MMNEFLRLKLDDVAVLCFIVCGEHTSVWRAVCIHNIHNFLSAHEPQPSGEKTLDFVFASVRAWVRASVDSRLRFLFKQPTEGGSRGPRPSLRVKSIGWRSVCLSVYQKWSLSKAGWKWPSGSLYWREWELCFSRAEVSWEIRCWQMRPGAINDSPSLKCEEYFTCGQTLETCHFTGKTGDWTLVTDNIGTEILCELCVWKRSERMRDGNTHDFSQIEKKPQKNKSIIFSSSAKYTN